MSSTYCVARTTIVSIAFVLLTNPALGQAPPDDLPIVGGPPATPLEVYYANPPGVSVETFLSGLDVVWGLEFAPDGRLFLTEKSGRIRVVSADGTLDPTPWATVVDVNADLREQGLMGLAIHPQFPEQPWIYVMYTVNKGGDNVVNRVSRFREVNGRGTGEEVLLDDLAAGRTHNGGRIRFGPDGMLYVGTGEARVRLRAQDLSNPAGSILRITAEGATPSDNPWPDNPIWAYGFRNPHGIAFRPDDGALFVADHGPTVEWEEPHRVGAYDELNIVREGGNYGWPLVVGAPGEPGFEDPIVAWAPSVPPGDLAFHNGDLFLTALWSAALIRIRFQDPGDPDRVTGIERWFNTQVWRDGVAGQDLYGRLRALAVGPDGALYMGTSNRDGRLEPGSEDDRVLRIVIDGGR